MENRFNLVDEPWIPVADHGRKSLRDIFSDPSLRSLGGSPREKIALLKLLQAIGQAAYTPKTEKEWLSTQPEDFYARVLAYLEQWRERFFLYGEQPFLQMPVSVAKTVSASAIIPHIATGNTSRVSHRQIEQPLDDAEKALLLVTSMSTSLGGKKTDKKIILTPGYTGKTAAARPGPATGYLGFLHSFVVSDNLRETVWLNTFSQQFIDELRIFPGGIGTVPWEQMPAGEACPVARAFKDTLQGRLVALSRFCLFTKEGSLHYVEGLQHDSYQEGKSDPSVAIDRGSSKLRALWVNPEKRPWRELVALLAFISSEGGGFDCPQLRLGLRRAREKSHAFAIWSGGMKVSGNAGEQYVSGSDDVVESEVWLESAWIGQLWWDRLKREMDDLEGVSKKVFACVSGYFQRLKMDRQGGAQKHGSNASMKFWQQMEGVFPDLMENAEIGEEHDAALKNTRKRIARMTYDLYDQACPRTTARQLEAWAAHRPNLHSYIQ